MTKPKELDLNLPALRGEAMEQLLTGLRLAVQRFDDLDAVERVLNAHANTAHAPALGQVRKIAKLAAEVESARPAFKRKRRWSNQSKHQELSAGIIKALSGALAPMQAGAIIKIMRTLGVKNFAQATFSRNLKALLDKGVIERVKEGHSPHPHYRLNPSAAEYQALPVSKKRGSVPGRPSSPNKTSLLVTEVLAARPDGMRSGEIVEGVSAKGFMPVGTSSVSACVYAYLRSQVLKGTIKMTGKSGNKVYKLQRPHFSVSREATA